MASIVQSTSGQTTSATSHTITLTSPPTVGNLIVLVSANTASAAQSSVSATGFVQDAISPTSSNQANGILSRVCDGTEGSVYTVQWASATTGVVIVYALEINAGAGKQWKSPRLAASGATASTGALTSSVTATGATTTPSYALAAVSLSTSNIVFDNAWTGGFTHSSLTTGSGRMSLATKDSASGETFSTSESWQTSALSRWSLAAYAIEDAPVVSGPQPPTGLTATPVSATQIDINYTRGSGAIGGEDIERDGTVIAVGYTGSLPYHDMGLTPSSTESYRARSVGS